MNVGAFHVWIISNHFDYDSIRVIKLDLTLVMPQQYVIFSCMPRLVSFSTIDKLLKTTVMLFLCEFLLRFMTCTMKFWIKYGLAFEFVTARIMKFSRSLPCKNCVQLLLLRPYLSQSSSFLWNRIYNKDIKEKNLRLCLHFFFEKSLVL